mgnify:CR=1 FL=1
MFLPVIKKYIMQKKDEYVILKIVKGGNMSASVIDKKMSKKTMKQSQSNEFEQYLQTRRENTTYNGIELESAGWQKELLGYKINK